MRRVRELEAWSKPGRLLHQDYGKDLAQLFWDIGIPRDIFLGLSQIPDAIHVYNLRSDLGDGLLIAEDFRTFCFNHSLIADLQSPESACQFLEYSYGRPVAWIHLPVGAEDLHLPRLSALLEERDLMIVGPDNLSCFLPPTRTDA